MKMYRLVFLIVILSFGFIGAAVTNSSSDTKSRFGPGSSKFVSVGADTRYENKWRLPSATEVSFFVAALMGGFKKQGEQNTKVIHDHLANQVKESMVPAEEYGIQIGPTLFDDFLDSQKKPGPRWEKVD